MNKNTVFRTMNSSKINLKEHKQSVNNLIEQLTTAKGNI